MSTVTDPVILQPPDADPAAFPWRLRTAEDDIKALQETAVTRTDFRKLEERVESMTKALYTAAIGMTVSALIFAATIFAVVH